jgi:hypothetical protein
MLIDLDELELAQGLLFLFLPDFPLEIFNFDILIEKPLDLLCQFGSFVLLQSESIVEVSHLISQLDYLVSLLFNPSLQIGHFDFIEYLLGP